MIAITTSNGNITLEGDVRATGSAGGAVNGIAALSANAGNGGGGNILGGAGGMVAAAGKGGAGGAITIGALLGTLTIEDNHAIAAYGGDGGDQSGLGGNGGDSKLTVKGSTGGKGGDVGPAGQGGIGGNLDVSAQAMPADINQTNAPGTHGAQSGTPGEGGKGKTPGKRGNIILG
jgi:hypothetical protein